MDLKKQAQAFVHITRTQDLSFSQVLDFQLPYGSIAFLGVETHLPSFRPILKSSLVGRQFFYRLEQLW